MTLAAPLSQVSPRPFPINAPRSAPFIPTAAPTPPAQWPVVPVRRRAPFPPPAQFLCCPSHHSVAQTPPPPSTASRPCPNALLPGRARRRPPPGGNAACPAREWSTPSAHHRQRWSPGRGRFALSDPRRPPPNAPTHTLPAPRRPTPACASVRTRGRRLTRASTVRRRRRAGGRLAGNGGIGGMAGRPPPHPPPPSFATAPLLAVLPAPSAR